MEPLIGNLRRVLLIINASAGVVSFVWLIILGQWWAIGLGFGAIAAPFILILLAIPGSYLSVPALAYMDKAKPQAAFMLILAARLYEWVVFTGWFALVFIVFLSRTLTENYLALLLWAYSMALAPWLYMAHSLRRREMGGDSTRIYILSAHVAYLAVAIMVFCAWFAPIHYILAFGSITVVGSITGAMLAFNWHYKVARANAATKAPETPPRR